MATLDRVGPSYTPWTPSASGIATEDEEYLGRHRKPDTGRVLSMRRMFYTPRHRRH